MINSLDRACHLSSDPLNCPAVEVSRVVHTGKRGRPRIEIDPYTLAYALQLRGPSHLGQVFQCNSRTVKRRAVEYGISEPGIPVYSQERQPDGSMVKIYNQHQQPHAMPAPSNHQLDTAIMAIIQNYPKIGRGKITAALKNQGIRATRKSIKESRLRVQGAPGLFGHRAIHRRKYFVPGANSLWHHDGQHGESVYNAV